MSDLKFIIRQLATETGGKSAESRTVAQACIMRGIPCPTSPIGDLPMWGEMMRAGEVIPVGSVEYVRAAMQAAGVDEPPNLSYPPALNQLLYRSVVQRRAGSLLENEQFIKPVRTKAFTGFVFELLGDPDKLDKHDREQYDAFMALDPDEPVWSSEVVRWQSEVRYYIHRGEIVGQGRYDPDGADGAPQPDLEVVREAVALMVAEHGADLTCALDFGVLSTGETALVEGNDFWAIGLYEKAVKPELYLEMLTTRWRQIAATPAPREVERP